MPWMEAQPSGVTSGQPNGRQIGLILCYSLQHCVICIAKLVHFNIRLPQCSLIVTAGSS